MSSGKSYMNGKIIEKKKKKQYIHLKQHKLNLAHAYIDHTEINIIIIYKQKISNK